MIGSAIAKTPPKKQIYIKTLAPSVCKDFTEKAKQFQTNKKLQYEYDNKKMSVAQISNGSDQINLVNIPIKDNTGYDYSKHNIAFDKDGNYLGSILLVFDKKEGNVYNIIAQTDNAKVEADIAENGKLIKMYSDDTDGICQDIGSFMGIISTSGYNENIISRIINEKIAYASCTYSCVDSCLSDIGVPEWVIATLGLVCNNLICRAVIGFGYLTELTYYLTDCGCYEGYEVIIL